MSRAPATVRCVFFHQRCLPRIEAFGQKTGDALRHGCTNARWIVTGLGQRRAGRRIAACNSVWRIVGKQRPERAHHRTKIHRQAQ